MLIVGDLLGIKSEQSRAFSFIYGMLPSVHPHGCRPTTHLHVATAQHTSNM